MGTTTVWIEPGCTRCGWCHQLLPTVFEAAPEGSRVTAQARMDRRPGSNSRERAALVPDHLDTATDQFLDFVADGCPARVIQVQRMASPGAAAP